VISEDAGRYLCDFIYFSSLTHLLKANEKRNVVFLHVPADASDKAITTGRELTLQLIRSLVESELAKGGSRDSLS
jgi:pyrrolidone-carboxylate peptidase